MNKTILYASMMVVMVLSVTAISTPLNDPFMFLEYMRAQALNLEKTCVGSNDAMVLGIQTSPLNISLLTNTTIVTQGPTHFLPYKVN